MDSEIILIQNPLDLSNLPAFVTARQHARIMEDRSYRQEIYSAGLQIYEGSGRSTPIDLRTLDTLWSAARNIPANMMVHPATEDEDDDENDEDDDDDDDDEDYEDYEDDEDDENDEEDEDDEGESNLDTEPTDGDSIEPDQK